MSAITESVQKLTEKYAKALGLSVLEVEYVKKPDGMHLVVYIDKKGGVNIDDCAALHEAIDAPLDVLDPTNGASYVLNVSSLGLDRNLNTDRLLSSVVGEPVDVSLFSKLLGKKFFDGVELKSYSESTVVLQLGEKEIEVPRSQISKITKHIIF